MPTDGDRACDLRRLVDAEEELEASRSRLRNIFESSLDMIISVDRERRITEFNGAAERTFGYRRDEVLGHVDAPQVAARHPQVRHGLGAHLARIDDVDPTAHASENVDQARAGGNSYHGGTSLSFFGDFGGDPDSYPSRPNDRILFGAENSAFIDAPGPLEGRLDPKLLKQLVPESTE